MARTSVQLGSDTMVQAETGILGMSRDEESKMAADVLPGGDRRSVVRFVFFLLKYGCIYGRVTKALTFPDISPES